MSEQLPIKCRINVRGVIYRDGQILGVRHRRNNGEIANYYATPGGGLDPHESLADGLVRELLEETNVEAKISKLLFIQQYASKRKGYTEELEFFFAVDNPEDFEAVDLTSASHGDAEIAVCEFIDPKTNPVLPEFLQTIDIGDHIKNDRPVRIMNYLS